MTPEQIADRDSVWERIAKERPEFTREMDISDNYHTVREIVLGGSLTWGECNRRFLPFVGARVMDVGANVGIYTAWCAANGATVVAYEPHPTAFALMNEMLLRSKLQAQVVTVNSAIAPYAGSVPFIAHVNPDQMCVWYNGAINPTDGRDVPCISFEEAIGTNDWDCVKMDIEGAEFEVLLSAPAEALRRINFMYVEFHPWASQDLYDRTIAKLKEVFDFTGFFPNEFGRWEVGYCHKK